MTVNDVVSDALTPQAPPRRRRSFVSLLVVVASFVVSELIVGIPVVAVAALWSPLAAFAVFTPVYWALDAALSLLVLRSLRSSRPGRYARSIAEKMDRERHPRIEAAVRAGQISGFVLASIFLGGPATIWLLYALGRHKALVTRAVISSGIFSVFIVGSYSGLTALALR